MKQRTFFAFFPAVLSLFFLSPPLDAQTAAPPAAPPAADSGGAPGAGGASPQITTPEDRRFPGEPYDVFIPSRTGPSVVPGSEPLPRSFRELKLGMSLPELKEALTEDGLFEFRGDPDVSFLPAKEENLVETSGLSFIRRAFFQLREGAVFIMAFTLDPRTVDHYSVFTSLVKKYGEPVSLSPREAVWENDETRVSLERPLTVKYIDMTVFKAIMGEAKAEESAELFRRQGFLNAF